MGLGDTADLCDGPNPFVEQSMPDRVVADVRAGKTWLRSSPCSAQPNTRRDEILKYNFHTWSRREHEPCSAPMPASRRNMHTVSPSITRSACTSASG